MSARRRAPAAARLLLGAGLALAVLGLGLAGARAAAVFEELSETGEPGLLRLGAHVATPLHATLRPGDTMIWVIEASMWDAERGALAASLNGSGPLIREGGLRARLDSCAGSFALPADADPQPRRDFDADAIPCSGERAVVLPQTPFEELLGGGEPLQLGELRSDEPRQLLLAVTLPAEADAEAVSRLTARLGLGVHASGDEGGGPGAEPGPGKGPGPESAGRLPVTGADLLALGLLGAGLVGVGAGAALRRGRRTGRGVGTGQGRS
ncbi:hypothetical protein [Leucobacter massiliensis]|uniref:Gram-positive cocci surface proteins LPxTG domain-containing protein n=1 Tax=Leucobacter massiliensis TaxID=1686285 RepID=A0A2S9QN07_9MICO|nr:hypothetical protein [Leucobacter massiliensis]PRI10971.1 hypothetical protein B4915_08790 [Leucobacter massiliensis]